MRQSRQLADRRFEQLKRELEIERNLLRLERNIAMAEIRTLSTPKLLRMLTNPGSIREWGALVVTLEERVLSREEGRMLEATLHELAAHIDRAPANERSAIERKLRRLTKALPPDCGESLIMPFLRHRRRARRQIGVLLLKGRDYSPQIVECLLEKYKATGDQQLLLAVAANSAAAVTKHEYLLRELVDRYWRMRVVEACLRASASFARKFLPKYPFETIYAAGRLEQRRTLRALSDAADRFSDDLECLSMYAWTCGKLRAVRELKKIRQRWRHMQVRYRPILRVRSGS